MKNMKLGTTTIYLFVFLVLNACSKKETIVNQIGTWTGTKTETIFENNIQTQKYTSFIHLTLSDDHKGVFREFASDDEVHWYYDEKNAKIFLSILSNDSLFGRQYTDMLFDIKTDKPNQQVWEREQTAILFQSNDRRKTVDTWELKK